mmetsp:Transcript_33551/g.107207  ORF Transcript_33551/g.107207 Transcript_33551/m.107207 type:complete len:90 (+) Transcript_33551:1751-2020(+)
MWLLFFSFLQGLAAHEHGGDDHCHISPPHVSIPRDSSDSPHFIPQDSPRSSLVFVSFSSSFLTLRSSPRKLKKKQTNPTKREAQALRAL